MNIQKQKIKNVQSWPQKVGENDDLNNRRRERCAILAADVEGWPRYRGKKEFLKYLRGEPLTHKEAILAACYRCSSAYNMGKGCMVLDCPLHPFMPYRESKIKLRKRAK